ncbi:MAG TPA: alcohol dehydrogenase catalytic domain-containing protein [Jatrophihabitans sp.]|jgi:threonine dehydrogenase-like Zn-dependent dehydrogenase|nr:alcohol dehydrogenase catalytic domain-containing protein [Jatrophihabitans sp.]
MRAAVVHGAQDVRIEDVPDPSLHEPTDATVQVTLACICGSDLWAYRGAFPVPEPRRAGHEFVGVVTEVGAAVGTLSVGDLVVAPFVWSDGDCFYCRHGVQTSCERGGGWGAPGADGGQGEYVRVPFADATLVRLPVDVRDERLPALLTLSDVLGTGHHAVLGSGLRAGDSVAVIGDGAVGLCAVLAARRLGASRIIVMSRNPVRSDVARRFGADDIVAERDDAGVAQVQALTEGRGADRVLECVGTDQAWATAVAAVRDGGRIGYVGVPAGVHDGLSLRPLFGRNIGIGGGVAPVRAYIDELLPDVLSGALDPAPVFDLSIDLDHVPDGYAAMDGRTAIKVLVDLR